MDQLEKKQAALIAIVGGVAIFGIKLLAYFLSNSVALLSDALESTVNIAASVLMLFSVYVSGKPADDTHNYGHQKVEELSSMLEGLLIIAAALIIIYAGAGRFFESTELLELNLAIGVSMVATALNGGLSWFLRSTARKSGSAALEADSKHLLSDVISSAGVWVGLLIVQLTGWAFLDSILAFAVAIVIARMGIGLVLKSSSHLMDESYDDGKEKQNTVASPVFSIQNCTCGKTFRTAQGLAGHKRFCEKAVQKLGAGESVGEWAQKFSKLEKNYEALSGLYAGSLKRLNELEGTINTLLRFVCPGGANLVGVNSSRIIELSAQLSALKSEVDTSQKKLEREIKGWVWNVIPERFRPKL